MEKPDYLIELDARDDAIAGRPPAEPLNLFYMRCYNAAKERIKWVTTQK